MYKNIDNILEEFDKEFSMIIGIDKFEDDKVIQNVDGTKYSDLEDIKAFIRTSIEQAFESTRVEERTFTMPDNSPWHSDAEAWNAARFYTIQRQKEFLNP